MKNEVPIERSRAAISSVPISIGAERTISTAVTNAAQQKIGRRDHVTPGARIVTIVAIMFMPSRTIEIPTSAKNMM